MAQCKGCPAFYEVTKENVRSTAGGCEGCPFGVVGEPCPFDVGGMPEDWRI